MKTAVFLIPALVLSAPAHALSVISLHGSAPSQLWSTSADMAAIIASTLALAAAVGFRVFRR